MHKEFYELPIWRDGYELLMQVYKCTDTFPDYEKYALAAQLIRSANSIIANFAESHGRFSYADKIRILYISRGELSETRSHLAVAFGRKYITLKEFERLNKGYSSLVKEINLYINGLSRKK